ncbi:MAG: hypothetical protein KBS59_05585, partial [Clostridiales bacterium]|nr:hypothetical protein [Clostridiales bacterium]
MTNFWDYNVWGFLGLMSILLIGLLAGNLLKKSVKFLKYSLIPTSVIGGILVLIVALIYEAITGTDIFDTEFFAYKGSSVLEMITYHCLALGFIASIFKPSSEKLTKKRSIEILNTGMTTVSSYLLQGILGIAITYSLSFIIKDFFAASGVLLPFGYGQGTGQA